MHARRTFPRWVSLCAAALAVLQLGGTLHLATAPHGVCWEHGVVIDLDAAPAGGDHAAPPEGLAPAPVSLVKTDAHPHCPALWVQRPARLEVPSAAPAAGCPHLASLVAPPAAVPPRAGWPLRCAPKHSPPV